MNRFVLAACLSVPGLALAQQGNAQPVFNPSASQVFVIEDIYSIVRKAQPDLQVPLRYDSRAFEAGEEVLITVEGDGVKLPDEQFTIPEVRSP